MANAEKSNSSATPAIALISNFGRFLLYMTTCWIAIVALKEHHSFNTFKHVFIPSFGLAANGVCMLFYLVGPWMAPGMNKTEPYVALGVVAAWGIYGLVYFRRRSAKLGRPVFLTQRSAAAS
jgi:hypothetical protein